MFDRYLAVLLLPLCLGAQTALENTGKPMQVAYDCAPAELQAAGLACSEEDPCSVYLELANADTAGSKIFVTGNLHTPMATLDSILLVSDDGGKSWTEPHPRLHSSGLDQIQFVDPQTGWISGANLQSAPRDPFFLVTTDGGKTWRERPIFDESRVAAIEGFHFDSPANGTLWIDATLDSGKHEEYSTENGGEAWAATDRAAKPKQAGTGMLRIRTEASTHSYMIEKSEGGRWQKIASFLVNLATCKE